MTKLRWGIVVACLLMGGCAGATGAQGMASADPTERGLSYVAAAIVTNGVMRGILNR